MSYVVGLPNNSYKPITNTAWARARLCTLQKGCTRLAASSTTKTGRHDIAEILMKVALKHKKKDLLGLTTTLVTLDVTHN
jgi:hypothetical protein